MEPVALRGSNVGAELLMLDNLRHVYTPTPLLDHLMDPTKSTADLPSSYAPEVWGDLFGRIRSLSAEGLEAFKSHVQRLLLRLKLEHALNSDQERSLADFAAQLFSPTKPTLLIHGVFGSGKSHLIAVMILFMGQVASYFGEEVPPPKVLVASMTNTAVDNILQLLLIKGFDRFVRVGSLKRIQRSILPYSVQSKTRVEDDIRELRSMYEDSDVSDSDIQLIDSTIKRFQSNDPHYSTSAILNRTHVVGATCLASSFPCLDGIAFSVVILDEVSQLTEPMSMLPILKFHARTVVLVGDPLQLPPTIPSADHRPILQRRLRFTLFDRLLKAGVVPVMLKAQYRCHPQLSKISNNLFYHSKLSDGITSSDRPPCLEGLPTLCFVDVSGGKEQRQFGKRSLHNEDEIRVISDLIQGLFQSNVPLSDIGVIAMYKLQVEMLQHELGLRALASPKVRHGVRISTVDAFQGAEMEIMIVSCVRSSHSTSPFLNNPHRINVALTRGRRHLFLVGNAKLLRKHSIWRDIIENHCKRAPGGFMPDDEFLSLLNVCPSAPKPPEPVRRKLASKPRLTGLSAPFRPPTKMKPKSPKDLQPKSHNADVPLAAEAPTFPFLPEPGWPQSPPPSAAMEVSPKRSASTPNATLEKFLVTQDSSGHKFQNVSGLNELYDEDLEGGSSTQPLYDQPYDMDALEFSSQADPDYSVIFKRLLDE